MTDWSKVCPICNRWHCVCLSPDRKKELQDALEADRRAKEAEEERKRQEYIDAVAQKGKEPLTDFERGQLRDLITRFSDDPQAKLQRMLRAHEERNRELLKR